MTQKAGNHQDNAGDLNHSKNLVSDYAMAFDTMAKISHLESETEVIGNILSLLEMLFIPETLFYISFTNHQEKDVHALSALKEKIELIKKRIVPFPNQYRWLPSQTGFQVKIQHRGINLGILEIDKLKFPENKDRYLNLTLAIADVCGLAIDNARKHQKLIESENTIRIEKEKLEQALEEIKTLTGLLPICSHCKKIKDDQGYWNNLEHYIEQHSQAQFSHSICQDCALILYPDLDLFPDEDE